MTHGMSISGSAYVETNNHPIQGFATSCWCCQVPHQLDFHRLSLQDSACLAVVHRQAESSHIKAAPRKEPEEATGGTSKKQQTLQQMGNRLCEDMTHVMSHESGLSASSIHSLPPCSLPAFSFTHWFTYSLTRPLVHTLIHPLTHLSIG